MTQAAIMPAQIAATPGQKPSATPAPAATRLDGMGRKTSEASRAAMAAAMYQLDASRRSSWSASALNQSSNKKNGTRINATSTSVTASQRTEKRYQTSESISLSRDT